MGDFDSDFQSALDCKAVGRQVVAVQLSWCSGGWPMSTKLRINRPWEELPGSG